MPRYQEDSIIEALCEVVFAPGDPWDPTVFGAFRHRITDELLPIRESGEVVDFALQPAKDGLKHVTHRSPRMRFFSSDRARLAQVGENVLVANVLRPYPHWEVFKPFILQTFRAYVAAASPVRVERLTLRYIDRIELPDEASVLGDWVATTSPYLPTYLADAQQGAFNRVEKPVDGGTEALTLTLDVDEGTRVLRLDTELVSVGPAMEPAALDPLLESLHDRINEIFEACISERTRELLKLMDAAS